MIRGMDSCLHCRVQPRSESLDSTGFMRDSATADKAGVLS
ncbi:hypothetical protein SBA1_640025 [Candidatus Sulfotelmatobacter kueseliae]|uniref:Uncharacterized protein n=1 Tax=Candidatus Sulfotelmatobacter kueseliae TaxID=2042962 RepID=A0A2U3L2W8_9BACT|nr:hypothetical protein SBA1_640025 [Candidatus Sulfotelmatobacter kueseliae]